MAGKTWQKRSASAYQGALEAVFSILIGVLVGYWADGHFGTSPRYLLVGLAIGFAAFVLRLWRLGRAMQGPADGSGGGSPQDEASPAAPEGTDRTDEDPR